MKYTKAKLPNICTIKTGKHDANHANKEGKYRFYTCSNQYSKCDTYSFTGESVIVPGNGDIGLVFYYDGEFDAYQRTYVLNDIKILPKYLFYHMQLYWRNFNDQKKFGSTVKYVRMSNFTNYEISYPSIEKQQCIVAKIEELFSELDNAVETLNATKAQLKLYKQAVLKSAFSRCIELKKAEDLCFFITKGTTPKKAEFQLEDKSIPFIKVYNLTFDGSLDFTIEPTFIAKSIHETSLARSIVYPGDVLMNIVGPPMGKVSIVPSSYDEWNINQAIARFRCKEELNNRYLAYFLMSSETVEKMSKQTKATAGQFNLTLETCRNIDIPVCSINEQLRIVDNLDTQLTAYNNIEKTVNDALQQATSMRQSILKQAFEGRLL